MHLYFALVLLFCAPLMFAQAAAVPVEREPFHHLILANRYTRVFRVEVPPHQATLLHHHAHDYVAVTLGAAEIQNDVKGKPAVSAKPVEGAADFVSGNFSHRISNTGNSPFRNITIEILKKARAAKAGKTERGMEIGHGGLSDVVIDNPEVRVTDAQIASGGMLHRRHYAHPHLVMAVTDLELHEMSRNPPAMLHLKAGDVKWAPASTQELMNAGQQTARFLVIEFK